MSHPSKERTLVLLKPDAIQRSLIAEIISRYERLGLKLIGLKMVVPTAKEVEGHYTLDPDWRRVTGEKTINSYRDRGLPPPSEDPLQITAVILKNLIKYLTSGPVIAMVWQGAHSVELVRKIMADQDTRAVRNLLHASGSVKEAEMEIPHWFKKEELIDYRVTHEDILYSKELEGIFRV